MKKSVIFLLCALLLLCACGKTEEPAPAPQEPEEIEQTEPVENPPQDEIPSGAVAYTDDSVNEKYYADGSDDILVSLEINLPKVKNNADIAYFYENLKEKLVEEAKSYIESAKLEKKNAEEYGGSFAEFAFSTDYSVCRNDALFFSVLRNYYCYTGGAHPNTVLFLDNFNPQTGGRLAFSDLFNIPEKEAYERISTYILEQMDANDKANDFDMYYPSAREDLYGSWNNEDFYLTEDDLMIVYQSYSIAPYAAGIQEFAVPLSGIADILATK